MLNEHRSLIYAGLIGSFFWTYTTASHAADQPDTLIRLVEANIAVDELDQDEMAEIRGAGAGEFVIEFPIPEIVVELTPGFGAIPTFPIPIDIGPDQPIKIPGGRVGGYVVIEGRNGAFGYSWVSNDGHGSRSSSGAFSFSGPN